MILVYRNIRGTQLNCLFLYRADRRFPFQTPLLPSTLSFIIYFWVLSHLSYCLEKYSATIVIPQMQNLNEIYNRIMYLIKAV